MAHPRQSIVLLPCDLVSGADLFRGAYLGAGQTGGDFERHELLVAGGIKACDVGFCDGFAEFVKEWSHGDGVADSLVVSAARRFLRLPAKDSFGRSMTNADRFPTLKT